ncbi:MAG: hypothetical protein GX029_05895 [Pseudomonadaceae bacterium]|nr:hypothetical protein [Pseudomonadaceae bacterium]
MGFWSSLGSTISSGTISSIGLPETKATKESTSAELKKAHGFKSFEAYKSELKNFSLEVESESTDAIANLKNKATNKHG